MSSKPEPKIGDTVVENNWHYGTRTGKIVAIRTWADYTVCYAVLFDRQYPNGFVADTNEEEIEDCIFDTNDDDVSFNEVERIWTFDFKKPTPEHQRILDSLTSSINLYLKK